MLLGTDSVLVFFRPEEERGYGFFCVANSRELLYHRGMSRKKEKKIKRLQHTPVWRRVAGIIVTRSLFIGGTMIVCSIAAMGIVNTIFLDAMGDARKVVEYVNEAYGKTDPAEFAGQMDMSIRHFDSIDGVFLLDASSRTVREAFGGTDEDIARVTAPLGSDDQDTFDREGSVAVLGDAFDTSADFSVGSFESRPGQFVSMFNAMTVFADRELSAWAAKESFRLNFTAYYKSDVPGVHVCFKEVFSLNVFQATVLMLLATLLGSATMGCMVVAVFKVIAAVAQQRRINQLVAIDTVTGGNNKAYFLQRSRTLMRLRPANSYAVVQLHLNKYHNFCTAYGVKQGENLLEDLDRAIVARLRKKELCAHTEKADFALLLLCPSQENLDGRLRSLMDGLRALKENQYLTFACGVVPVGAKSRDAATLLTHAGIALSKAVALQKDIVWFADEMKDAQVWERRIEDDMERALQNHEFTVYLQPKYSTKKEVLAAAEALVRWIHPELGFIPPGKFIPQFEKNGFILKLDDYMLDEVSRLQSEWLKAGKKLVPISVNVSRAHFAEENLAEHICAVVNRYGVPHEFIELELTESAFFDDKAVLLETVKKLKGYGFRISMDDFGAGYSSLNSLKELPLDIIKLDAEFFRSVVNLERSNQIVGDTISLAKKLGMQVVAEGIETREQVDFLAAQDCDLIQGFYFSKPLPVKDFEDRAGY